MLALGVAPRVFAHGVAYVRGAVADKTGASVAGADVATPPKIDYFS